MKLKQLLQPPDSSLSTPKAARKLLRILAWVSLLCITIGASLYLTARLYGEISHLRRHMNDAMYSAQSYLLKRESLLTHLNRSVVLHEANPIPINRFKGPLPFYGRANIALGDIHNEWSILLSGRDFGDLDDLGSEFLYVSPQAPFTVSYLHRRTLIDHPMPNSVLEALMLKANTEGRNTVHWLADPADPQSRIYLFERLSLDQNAGWLGLTIDGGALASSLTTRKAGQYILLNESRRKIMSSRGVRDISDEFAGVLEHDSFAFSGNKLVPTHLALSKEVGSAQWTLIYYFDLWELVFPLSAEILAVMLACVLIAHLVWYLVRRITRRLINPALEQLEQLVESEELCRTIIETSPVALCLLRRSDGQVVLENMLARLWLGHRENWHHWSDTWLDKAFNKPRLKSHEEITTREGRHLLLSFTPTRYKGEEALFCVFSDISVRKQIEKTFEQAKLMADAANDAKSIFLATMSHEIRTPLYGVMGTLELLGLTPLNAQQRGYLQAIQRSSSVLGQLLNDVLDVSKIEAGQLVLEPVEFSVLELVQDTVSAYAGMARRKGLQIYAICDPSLPDTVLGDATRIRQILNNLLSNAVKFTDSGRIVVRAKVVRRDREMIDVLWQVADTGTGIAKQDQERLFEPFYQVAGQGSATSGTGLGLSICNRLAQLMNGEIRVVSEAGLGSSFCLMLPLQSSSASYRHFGGDQPVRHAVFVCSPVRELAECVAGWLNKIGFRAYQGLSHVTGRAWENAVLLELLPGGDEKLTYEWPGQRIVATGQYGEPHKKNGLWYVGLHSMQSIYRAVELAQGLSTEYGGPLMPEVLTCNLGLKVLVAEDNPINQIVLGEQLASIGCEVVMTSDGSEALVNWRAGKFDLILTDIRMPNKNGYELARELRLLGCDIPIVGTTANAMHDETMRCLDAGIDFCLVKPVDLNTLLSTLSALTQEDSKCFPTEF